MKHLKMFEFILYVTDQQKSATFYIALLRQEPNLHVPGMTEFILADNCKLGLMPNTGIAKILENNTPHPAEGNGIPRCELYFYVDDLDLEYSNAVRVGAKVISPIADRSWGDSACYFADPDGHIIAFAVKLPVQNS